MKKQPNNQSPGSFRLPRSAILRGKRNYHRVFTQGSTLKARHLDLRYLFLEDPKEGCLIGFVTRRKLGNAITRNRFRRIIREAYRKNQHVLLDHIQTQHFGFHGVFIAKDRHAGYHEYEADCIKLMKQVRKKQPYVEPS